MARLQTVPTGAAGRREPSAGRRQWLRRKAGQTATPRQRDVTTGSPQPAGSRRSAVAVQATVVNFEAAGQAFGSAGDPSCRSTLLDDHFTPNAFGL